MSSSLLKHSVLDKYTDSTAPEFQMSIWIMILVWDQIGFSFPYFTWQPT